MQTKIEQFLVELNAKFPQVGIFDKCYVLKKGSKYTKIMTAASPEHSGNSAYAFIDNKSGDVFKAASWAAPAKHTRGNINDASGLAACGRYGVTCLR